MGGSFGFHQACCTLEEVFPIKPLWGMRVKVKRNRFPRQDGVVNVQYLPKDELIRICAPTVLWGGCWV